jgi:hypothetical protein
MFDDAVFWLSLGTLFVVLLSLALKTSTTSDNSRIEWKLDLIIYHLGIHPDQGMDEKIVQLVKAGRKIEAIKLYREHAAVGLKEAKDYVEALEFGRSRLQHCGPLNGDGLN